MLEFSVFVATKRFSPRYSISQMRLGSHPILMRLPGVSEIVLMPFSFVKNSDSCNSFSSSFVQNVSQSRAPVNCDNMFSIRTDIFIPLRVE